MLSALRQQIRSPARHIRQFNRSSVSQYQGKGDSFPERGSEDGSGAATDDIANSDAAYNSETNPEAAAKQIEKETGEDMGNSTPNPANTRSSVGDAARRQDVPSGATQDNTRKSGGSASFGANPSPTPKAK